MAIIQPERVWWKPVGRQEKIWLFTSIVFVVVLFLSMPLWHLFAMQNTPAVAYRVAPEQYQSIVDQYVQQYQVGTENGVPVVRPPDGDIFLLARKFMFYPILELQKGKTYKLHTSSLDVNHGFSIQPINMNFQVIPGYDYVITLTPAEAGDFVIVCNEYCGIGHHNMSGKLIVRE